MRQIFALFASLAVATVALAQPAALNRQLVLAAERGDALEVRRLFAAGDQERAVLLLILPVDADPGARGRAGVVKLTLAPGPT